MNTVGVLTVIVFASALALEPAQADGPPAQATANDPALDALLADPETAPALLESLRCRKNGEDDEALKHLRRANAAIKKKHGANTPEQLPVLDLAGEILFVAGRFAEAVAPLERAVAIREPLAAEGDHDHEVALASSLLLLGKAQAETGNVGKAWDALTRAAELFTSSLGEEHEATRTARQSLAAISTGKDAP